MIFQLKEFFILSIFLLTSINAFAIEKVINYIMPDETNKPFSIKNDKERGIITEIVDKSFKELGYQINYISIPQIRLIYETEKYQQNKSDAIRSFVMYSSPVWQSKDKPFYYSKPLFKMKYALVCSAKKFTHYNDISSLYGKSIVLIKGFQYPELNDYINNQKIHAVSVNSGLQALNMIHAKYRDEACFIEFHTRVKFLIKEHNLNKNDYVFFDFSNVIKPVPIHLVLSDDFSKEDLEHLNKIINSSIKDKVYENIIKKYE
ncbi:substrate-binding periplasmic protein [Silvanigrella aquatica]|uniref:Uncharacterized protein n=1 Tax=Silvanigrella aquatica TaxID=1915309 RepID=A0A1L4D193_9BACT|nr:transporter substrate-binding domain-containing protein [Silvanigrella aquatica]APJ03972.1 hypothetical protein AXG55_08650 [Silvanigrella aquatica]